MNGDESRSQLTIETVTIAEGLTIEKLTKAGAGGYWKSTLFAVKTVIVDLFPLLGSLEMN